MRRRIAPVEAPLTSRTPARKQRAADDRRAGVADQGGERAADREPDEAARVLAEQRHEAQEAHAHAEPERPDVEEVAPREQEAAEGDERHGQHVGGVADDIREDTSASHEPTAPPSRPR